MSATVTLNEIEKAYSSLIPTGDAKSQVEGQPTIKDFYNVRKIIWLYYQTLARAGDAGAQAIISAMPLSAVANNNLYTVQILYNNEQFTFGSGDVFVMTQDEASFIVDKSNDQETPLEIEDLVIYFVFGKIEFFYW